MVALSGLGDTEMNADMLSRIRILVFALAGLICATYSILALATNTANPISPWLLGFLASWLLGFLASWRVWRVWGGSWSCDVDIRHGRWAA